MPPGLTRAAQTARRPALRGLIRPAVACALVLFPGLSALAADEDHLERAVKAAYLCKLAEFVVWPPSSAPDDNFVLCVIGDDPIGALLDRAVQGQTVQNLPVVLRRLATVSGPQGCRMMVVSGSARQSVSDVLVRVSGTPVLTVTDTGDTGGPAGIINFVLSDGRVRFEIDRREAGINGLSISSKLLRLAVRVKDPVEP